MAIPELRASLKRLLLSDYYAANLVVLATYVLWLRRHVQTQAVPASPLSWVSGSADASFAAVSVCGCMAAARRF